MPGNKSYEGKPDEEPSGKPPREQDDENVVFRYTIQDAERDGILYRISRLNPVWERGAISHVTVNLLSKGYIAAGDEPGRAQIKGANLVDLLNQCNQPIIRDFRNKNLQDFYEVPVEFPDGHREPVWLELNELGKFTVLLPSDH